MGGNIVLDKQAFLPPPIEAGESCSHFDKYRKEKHENGKIAQNKSSTADA